MRDFVRDLGWQGKHAQEVVLLIGADLTSEPIRLEHVDSPMEECGLRPCQAPEPPHGVDNAVNEKLLHRSHWQEVCPNLVPNVLEGVHVFSRQDDLTGEEPMPDGVEADPGFTLRRLWPHGAACVPLVRGYLSFTRHGSCFPLFPITEKCIFVVKQSMRLHH